MRMQWTVSVRVLTLLSITQKFISILHLSVLACHTKQLTEEKTVSEIQKMWSMSLQMLTMVCGFPELPRGQIIQYRWAILFKIWTRNVKKEGGRRGREKVKARKCMQIGLKEQKNKAHRTGRKNENLKLTYQLPWGAGHFPLATQEAVPRSRTENISQFRYAPTWPGLLPLVILSP